MKTAEYRQSERMRDSGNRVWQPVERQVDNVAYCLKHFCDRYPIVQYVVGLF